MKGQKTLIRPLEPEDIPLLGKLYFPWSTPEETVEKWKRYLHTDSKFLCIFIPIGAAICFVRFA